MGISLSQWRCAIGKFIHRQRTAKSYGMVHRMRCKDSSLLSTSLKLCVVLSLLAIGCVEQNPGPQVQLKCHYCVFSSASAARYADHLSTHELNKNFQFRCPLCPSKCVNKRSLEVHLSRGHPSRKTQPQPLILPPSSSAHCTYPGCGREYSSVKELGAHLSDHLRQGEAIDCPIGMCASADKPKTWVTKFTKQQNFKVHLSRYHKSPLPASVPCTAPFDAPGPSQTSFLEEEVDSGEPMETESGGEAHSDDDVLENVEEESEAYNIDDICDFIAKFYLKLEADLLLPASTVQVIATHLSSIVNFSHAIVKKTMIREMTKSNLLPEDAERIAHVSLADDPLLREHNKNFGRVCLSTGHLRHKYYEKNYDFKKPKKEHLIIEKDGGETVKESIHCVSVRESLLQQLQDPQVQEDVEASFKRLESDDMDAEPVVYSDFTDGEVFRNHPASKQKCLYLNFFWDSFSVTNPLGSAKNSHKTIGVYYVLGNLAPERRSRVDVLQLSAVFFEAHFKKYSLDVCLQQIIKELKDLLVNGVKYKGITLPVFILFVLGDNLGSHQIGGFIECFRYDYWCRFCVITKREFQNNPHLVHEMRSKEDYEKWALKVKTEGLKNYLGIKFTSILNTLPGFHVCSPALPPCLAHDLLEGCFAYDMMLIVSYFIKNKWFTRIQFNQALKDFKFIGVDAADKPCTLELGKNRKLKARLSGSAVRNWNMIRYFSLIAHNYVKDVNNPVWKLYICMKLILEMVCAPVITAEDIVRLDYLIKSYLSERKELFPDNPLKPKHHFLAHYPALIRKFGPLIRLFTLRMESHHHLLKRIAKACNNFKDVTFTMAFKSQLRRSYISTGNLFSDVFSCTVSKIIDPLWGTDVRLFINSLKLPSAASCVKTVKINGTEYKRDRWLLIARQENTLIVGQIIAIFCHTSVDFIVKKYNTTAKADDYGLHKVNLDISLGLLHLSSLKKIESYYPLTGYALSGSYYLTLKYSPLPIEIAD